MENIFGVEAVNKLEGMDFSMLTKYVQKRSIKAPEIVQLNQLVKWNQLIPHQHLDRAKDLGKIQYQSPLGLWNRER